MIDNPHFKDIEAEKAVLGAVLVDNSCIYDIQSKLKPSDFSEASHAILWTIFIDKAEHRWPIDIISVSDAIKTGGYGIDEKYLYDVSAASFSSANVDYYVRIVKDKAVKRELWRINASSAEDLVQGNKPGIEIANDLEQKASDIATSTSVASYVKIGTVLPETLKRIEFYQAHPDELMGMPSGFKSIDRITGGIREEDYVIIGARPSQGKSSLLLTMADNIAIESGIPVGIFSCEMSKASLNERQIFSLSGVTKKRIQFGHLNASQMEKIKTACESIYNAPIYIDDTSNISLSAFKASARKMVKNEGVKMIFIDYIGLMNAEKPKLARWEQIGLISRQLKEFCRENHVPLVVLAQLNREAQGKKPTMADLRDSGCLAYGSKIFSYSLSKFINIGDMNAMTIGNVNSFSNGYNVVNDTKTVIYKGEKETVKITASTGHEITATLDHKIYTRRGWVEAGEINCDDKIAIPLNFGIEEETMSNDEVKLLALWLGNGCAVNNRSLQYTSNCLDENVCDELIDCINNMWPGEMRPYKKQQLYRGGASKAINVFVPAIRKVSRNYHNPMIAWLNKYGLYNVRGPHKTIPDAIFMQSTRIKRLFIKYLWATDGTVCIGKDNITSIAYSSSSYDLIFRLQYLLQSVGVLSNVSEQTNGKQIWYHLCIYSKHFQLLFFKSIGVAGDRKGGIANKLMEAAENRFAGWTKYELDGNIVYVPIKSICNDGVQPVFDVEVDRDHNFFANGILVHNCIEQDADMVFFLHREKEPEINAEIIETELICAKQRNGPVGTIKLNFYPELVKFEDAEA